MSELIDISLPVYPGMPLYPGVAETKIASFKSATGTSVLSEITLTSHTGTHIDAPSHAIEEGASIDSFELDVFYGPCRVLDMTLCEKSVTKTDLLPKNIRGGERVLLKTKNSLRGFDTFYEDYLYLEKDAAGYLADAGVILVGIDALSVKQKGSKDNTSHLALLEKNIPIIEGLNLSRAEESEYTLSALPLALEGLDGSPARAMLIRN